MFYDCSLFIPYVRPVRTFDGYTILCFYNNMRLLCENKYHYTYIILLLYRKFFFVHLFYRITMVEGLTVCYNHIKYELHQSGTTTSATHFLIIKLQTNIVNRTLRSCNMLYFIFIFFYFLHNK